MLHDELILILLFFHGCAPLVRLAALDSLDLGHLVRHTLFEVLGSLAVHVAGATVDEDTLQFLLVLLLQLKLGRCARVAEVRDHAQWSPSTDFLTLLLKLIDFGSICT